MKLTTEKIRELIREEITKIVEGQMFASRYDDVYDQGYERNTVKFKDAKVKHYYATTSSGEPRYFIEVLDGNLYGNVYQISLSLEKLEAAAKKLDRIGAFVSSYASSYPQEQQRKVFNSFVRGVGRGR